MFPGLQLLWIKAVPVVGEWGWLLSQFLPTYLWPVLTSPPLILLLFEGAIVPFPLLLIPSSLPSSLILCPPSRQCSLTFCKQVKPLRFTWGPGQLCQYICIHLHLVGLQTWWLCKVLLLAGKDSVWIQELSVPQNTTRWERSCSHCYSTGRVPECYWW